MHRTQAFLAVVSTLLLSFLLYGCQSSTTPAIQNDMPAIPSDFSSEQTFQGVSYKVDPSWDLSKGRDYEARYTAYKDQGKYGSISVSVEPFLSGETESLDSLMAANVITDAGNPEVSNETDAGGIKTYQVVWDSGEVRSDYLIGFDSATQHGYLLEVRYGSSELATEHNEESVAQFFAAVSYDPTQTTLDYCAEYKKEKWLRTSGITAGIPVAAPLHHMDERLMHPEDRGTRWRRVMQAV
ncbi:MAG: hypothetical protein LKE27_07535 [Atopobiaceae bacterium]|nr:hypothetical protein [Atopobiaceae bacterium]